jgi:hypothetical protein
MVELQIQSWHKLFKNLIYISAVPLAGIWPVFDRYRLLAKYRPAEQH